MELAFTQEEKTLKRKYRHFSISSRTSTADIVEKKKADFFYIGRKSSSIDCLIKSFETGYAAENVENAKFIISRLTSQEGTIPGVFIVDASLDKKEIADIFNGFSRSTAFLRLAAMKSRGLLTEDEFSRFSQETREVIALLLGE